MGDILLILGPRSAVHNICICVGKSKKWNVIGHNLNHFDTNNHRNPCHMNSDRNLAKQPRSRLSLMPYVQSLSSENKGRRTCIRSKGGRRKMFCSGSGLLGIATDIGIEE